MLSVLKKNVCGWIFTSNNENRLDLINVLLMRNKWNICETTINTQNGLLAMHTDCLHIPVKIFMHKNLEWIQITSN